MKYLLIFGMCLAFVSCGNKPVDENVLDEIIIQYRPSFHSLSMMSLDMAKGEVIFQRIGNKNYHINIPGDRPTYYPRTAPKSFVFSPDAESLRFFRDSIPFFGSDFEDRESDALDGIGCSILYVFRNGEVKDVDIKNDFTQNQTQLIHKLIQLSISHATDEATAAYLKELDQYIR